MRCDVADLPQWCKGLQIPLPPFLLQEKFAVLVKRLECLRAVQREALRQAEHLFGSLLHSAFSVDRTPNVRDPDYMKSARQRSGVPSPLIGAPRNAC